MKVIDIIEAKGLKPCPLCGYKDIYYESYETEVGIRWRILCPECMISLDVGWAQSIHSVDDVWNKRVLKDGAE